MNFNRKTKQGINVLYTAIIIGGILILINYIASAVFFRIDITQNNDYSVSKISKDTVRNLDDIVNIKGFFSKQVPPNLISIKQDVKDIIEEYKNYSNGKIKVNYVDPKDDEELAKEAKNLGIPELQFSSLEKDKYEVSTGYLGLAIIYGTKKEVIPVVDDTQNLEYELTSAIKKVMQKDDFTVAFLKGHGELDKESDISLASQQLGKLYNVVAADTTDGSLIPENIDTLIIAGAKEEFTDREKYAIDQFLMKGKSLLILQENINVGEMLQTTVNKNGIGAMLEHYGVKINNNFILDPSCEMASFSNGFLPFWTTYPFWPKIIKKGFNADSVIVSKLESITFPWTSSVELVEKNLGEKKAVKLISSTDRAWTQDSSHNLNPQQNFETTNQGIKDVAVFISGKFESYFNDKNKPVSGETQQKEEPEFISETTYGRLLVVGDSDFMTDQFLKRFNYNMLFFQNAVDALTMDETLIQIRSKGISDRPIKELSDAARSSIKFFNIFAITILVLLAGILKYFLRKRTKFSDQI
ncbi:MAG: GldG family protein [bacterium]